MYGANDGIITTFAVISGAAGALLSTGPIVILGLASLIADGISMGLSNYLAISSRLDYQKDERKREEFEVENFHDKERGEVKDILKKWDIHESRIEAVLDDITKNKKNWVDIMMREELGIFEDQLESPAKHGLVTSIAFVISGFLPLIPYLIGIQTSSPFILSLLTTAVSLFIVGAARTYITGSSWWKSGIQMLLIGGLAALTAYFVGGIVKDIFGIII